MYWLTLNELTPLKLHKNIVIGQELSPESLKAYDSYLHEKIFLLPPCSVPKSLRLSATVIPRSMSSAEKQPHIRVVPAKMASQSLMGMDGS